MDGDLPMPAVEDAMKTALMLATLAVALVRDPKPNRSNSFEQPFADGRCRASEVNVRGLHDPCRDQRPYCDALARR